MSAAGPVGPAGPPPPTTPTPATTATPTTPAGEFARPLRLHALTPLLDVLAAAPRAVVPVGAMVLAGGRQLGLLAVVAAIGLVSLVAGVVRWWRFTYWLDGDTLRVEDGVLARRVRSVPVGRIQQVDVRARLRHRVAGVVELRFDTAAGGGDAEVALAVMGAAQADRLRSLVLARRAATTAADDAGGPAPPGPEGAAAGPDAAPADAAPGEERVLVALGVARLAVAGVTGARLAAALAALGFVARLLDDAPRSFVERALDELPRGTAAVVAAVVLLGPVWLGLAAASAIVTDHGFTLVDADGELRARRGLVDRRETTVARRRVQAVRIDQSFLRRLLGLASLQLQTAGGAREADDDVSRLTVPLVRVGELDALVAALAPGLEALPALAPAPPAARRRAIVRRVAVAVALAAGPALAAALLLDGPAAVAAGAAVLVVAAGAGAGAGELAYRGLGHALAGAGGSHLVARRGGLFRETVVVPVAKAQSARLRSTPFQRRAGLATLEVDVAGRGRTPAVPEVEAGRLAGLQRAVLGAPGARRDEALARRSLRRAAAQDGSAA